MGIACSRSAAPTASCGSGDFFARPSPLRRIFSTWPSGSPSGWSAGRFQLFPCCRSACRRWSGRLAGGPGCFCRPSFFERLDATAQEAILAHELAHVRRKDHWVRLLELVVTTLFWWHPAVWWACRRIAGVGRPVLRRDGGRPGARTGAKGLCHRADGYVGFPFRAVGGRSAGGDGRQVFRLFGEENSHVEEPCVPERD